MKFTLDKTLGYMYSYDPTHPLANKAGKVYEHIYVMTNHLKRPLAENECVHHKDRNRANNDLQNLQLLTSSEHRRLHLIEDHGIIFYDVKCKRCDTVFETTNKSSRVYCSNSCASESSKKFEIAKEELEILVWKYPTCKVATMLGVSDVAVAKRCKKLGIDKPPRGYWRKVETNTL